MKLTIRDMILVGLFSALMVVGAYIRIPMPYVAVTFQLFFCIYAGLFLGKYKGALSQIIYVILGLIGLPVFSEGGGLAYVFKSSFGFILGFIVCAFVVGAISERMKKVTLLGIGFASLAGFVLTYIVGDLYMYIILNNVNNVQTSLVTINGWMIPFMIKDLILVGIIVATTRYVLPSLRKAGYTTVVSN